MGIVTNCGSNLLATRDQIYKASTVKAKMENESFSAQMIGQVVILYPQYCSKAASSKKKVASPVPAHIAFVPDSTARQAFPRGLS